MRLAVNELVEKTLGVADIEHAAGLLSRAFFDNPAHAFIYPNTETRLRRLYWLMKASLRAQLSIGRSFSERDGAGRIVGMGIWIPPEAGDVRLIQLARFGFLSMPFRHGLTSFKRMLLTVREIEERRAKALGGQRSWFLDNVAVSEGMRGKGVGARMLRSQLANVTDPSGHPVSLTTQRQGNVSLYASLGFSVVEDTPISDGNAEFPNWVMVREATTR